MPQPDCVATSPLPAGTNHHFARRARSRAPRGAGACRAEAAHLRLHARATVWTNTSIRHDVHDAAEGVRPEEGRTRTTYNLHTRHPIKVDERVGANVRHVSGTAVETLSVQHDQDARVEVADTRQPTHRGVLVVQVVPRGEATNGTQQIRERAIAVVADFLGGNDRHGCGSITCVLCVTRRAEHKV